MTAVNAVNAVRAGRDGFALVATLWLVVGIGVVGLEWGLRARDQRRAALNFVDRAAARAAAEAGVAQARARLDDALARGQRVETTSQSRPGFDPWRDLAFLMPDTARSDGGVGWRVILEDGGARLDLNRASVDELRRLMVALRIDAGRADRIAQSIADWREPEDGRRARGGDRAQYLREGRLVLPRHAPFQRVGELRHVLGVTPDIYERLAPLLSLHGTGRVNLMAAPRPVLLALPGLGEEAARALERRRLDGRPLGTLAALGDELPPSARAALAEALPELMDRTTLETEEVHIISEGRVDGSPIRVRADAIVVRSGAASYLVRLEVGS